MFVCFLQGFSPVLLSILPSFDMTNSSIDLPASIFGIICFSKSYKSIFSGWQGYLEDILAYLKISWLILKISWLILKISWPRLKNQEKWWTKMDYLWQTKMVLLLLAEPASVTARDSSRDIFTCQINPSGCCSVDQAEQEKQICWWIFFWCHYSVW